MFASLERVTRTPRIALPVLAFALGAASVVGVGSSCTIFNGVVFHADGGYDASSDSGGDAGDGGTVATYLSLADAAKICSLLRACPEPELQTSIAVSIAVPVDPLNTSLCTTWLAGPIDPGHIGFDVQKQELACLAKATDCVSAGKCLDDEIIADVDSRCSAIIQDAGPDADTTLCSDPETVLRCGVSGNSILHCNTPYFGSNAKCLPGTDGSKWCVAADNCNSASSSCESTLFVYCSIGLKFQVDCASVGTTCGVDPMTQQFNCLTDGTYQMCQSSGTQCQKDRVLMCDASVYSVFDCAALGGTCDASHGGAFCKRPGDACTPFDTGVNTCKDAKTIELCVGGQKTSFDCSSIGKACVGAANAGCQ